MRHSILTNRCAYLVGHVNIDQDRKKTGEKKKQKKKTSEKEKKKNNNTTTTTKTATNKTNVINMKNRLIMCVVARPFNQ